MSKIEKLSLNKTIDYSNEIISYFIKENDTSSNLQKFEEIIHKIHNAKKTILLSSTKNISNEIIDALYTNNKANIYIILKSFDSSEQTLDRFDSQKPAILREVNKIENNMIIVDNISYVFINSLDNKENIFIKIDKDKTKDLKYIFNHYFWDCATLEKLVDNISEPAKSPFPPIFQRELDYINIAEYDLDNIEKLYLPRDEKYKSILLDKQSEYKYVSDKISSIIYQKQNLLQIGCFVFREIEFNITNKWIFKQNILKEIRNEDRIIPIDENWHETINIQDYKKIQLENIEAKTIEEMEITQAKIPAEKYIKEINFSWEVIPPSKPTNAKKSDLYSSYEKLNTEFKNQLDMLNSELADLERESSSSSMGFFIGGNRKAKQNIRKIKEYKTKDLTDFSKIDLEKFIKIEFKEFYENIFKAKTDFKEDKKRKEAKDEWKNKKEQKTKNLKSKETKLAEKKKELNNLKNERRKEKLDKNIKSIEFEINKLNKELSDNYLEFTYKAKQNEIKNFNKNKTILHDYKKLNIPKYILPEVGILYETNDSYFLEIVYKQDIIKAYELKQRYCDKDYKVVVGAKNE